MMFLTDQYAIRVDKNPIASQLSDCVSSATQRDDRDRAKRFLNKENHFQVKKNLRFSGCLTFLSSHS